MRGTMVLLLVVVTFLAGGCAASLHPVAPEKGHVFDPALLGTWKRVEPKDVDNPVITVVSPDNDSYEASFHDEGKTMAQVYTIYLFRLNGVLFYDGAFSRVALRDETIKAGEVPAYPVHAFGRLWIDEDEVRANVLDEDWLEKALKEKKLQLSHEAGSRESGIDILLTGPSEEIRDFSQKSADEKDAFQQWVFRRQK